MKTRLLFLAGAAACALFTEVDPACAQTWTPTSAPTESWGSVASSADGNKLVAVVRGGGIWTLQSTSAPLASIAPASTNFLLSWIVPSLDFRLQENSDLTTTNWTDVANTPTLSLTSR